MPRVTRAELARQKTRKPRPLTRADTREDLARLVGRPRERDIQRAVLTYLNSVPGVCAWKAGAGLLPLADGRRVRMGKAGVSDVIGWFRVHRVSVQPWQRCGMQRCERQHIPVWFAIECKRPGGKATPAQLDFLARLREAGSPLAMVASSVDEVRRAVEAL